MRVAIECDKAAREAARELYDLVVDGSDTRAACIYELKNGNAARLRDLQEAACEVASSANVIVEKVVSLHAPDVPVPAMLKGAPPPSREPLRDGEWPKDRLKEFKAAFVEPLERAPGGF